MKKKLWSIIFVLLISLGLFTSVAHADDKVKSIKLSTTTFHTMAGVSYSFDARITPDTIHTKVLKWTCSNTNVVKIYDIGNSTNGFASCFFDTLKTGKAVITCKATDGSGVVAKCSVVVHPFSAYFSKVYNRMKIGQTKNVVIDVHYAKGQKELPYKISLKSSNTNIARTNSAKMTMTAVGKGTATITAIVKLSNGEVFRCTGKAIVTPVDVTGVTLNKKTLTIQKGYQFQLKATISPKTATNQAVTWKSSAPTVVKVSSTGKITALKKGTSTITVITKDGNKKATCKVTVK